MAFPLYSHGVKNSARKIKTKNQIPKGYKNSLARDAVGVIPQL